MKKYIAFISYKHNEYDKRVASGLHRGLELFHAPKGNCYSTKRRVFRDEEELKTGSDLGEEIRLALSDSEYLIVLCSPDLLTSEWCLKEIQTFIDLGKKEKILPVLIAGDKNSSIPDMIKNLPVVVDITQESKSNLRQRMGREDVAQLLSLMLGIPKLELLKYEFRFKTLVVTLVATFLALAFAIFGIYAYNTATIISRNNVLIEIATEDSRLAEKRAMEARNDAIIKRAAVVAEDGRMMVKNGQYIEAIKTVLTVLPDDNMQDIPVSEEAVAVLRTALVSMAIDDKNDTIINFFEDNGYESRISWIDYSEDGRYVFVEETNRTITKWDLLIGKPVWKSKSDFSAMNESGSSTSLGEEGKCIYQTVEGHLFKYDAETGNILLEKNIPNSDVRVESSNSSVLILQGLFSGAQNICGIDKESGELLWQYTLEERINQEGLAMSEDGSTFYALEQRLGPENQLQSIVYVAADPKTGNRLWDKVIATPGKGFTSFSVTSVGSHQHVVLKYGSCEVPYCDHFLIDMHGGGITSSFTTDIDSYILTEGRDSLFIYQSVTDPFSLNRKYRYAFVDEKGNQSEYFYYDLDEPVPELISDTELIGFNNRSLILKDKVLYDYDTLDPVLYCDGFEVVGAEHSEAPVLYRRNNFTGTLRYYDNATLIKLGKEYVEGFYE